MNRGYVNMQPFDIDHVFMIRTDTGTKNGTVKGEDLIIFCMEKQLDELCLYGPKSYTEGIKKRLDRDLKSKYNYRNCTIYLSDDN